MALPRPPPAAIPTKLSALDFQRALVLCVGLDNGIKAFLPLTIDIALRADLDTITFIAHADRQWDKTTLDKPI